MKANLIFCSWIFCFDTFFAIASDGPNEPVIEDQGRDYRVWRHLDGGGYVERASGLDYMRDGQWHASKEEIRLEGNGDVADSAGHVVHFSANIKTVGAVVLDSKRPIIFACALACSESRIRTGSVATACSSPN